MFDAKKNPDTKTISRIIRGSKVHAARRIIDPETGDIWVWDAALADHRTGASKLGVSYSKLPGEGDILTL